MQIRFRDTVLPILALGFLTLSAMPQDDANAGLALRVQVLEAHVQEMRGSMEAQQKAAAALLTSLDAAEEAGFTAGINPKSREILLGAWRAQAKALGSPAKKPEEGKKGKKRSRR
ncbi:MAG: hypothetical protein P1V35_00075 [Planctomycetota bacterium]|nr:hypothetical protein [Planctomycetota bacterium]